MQALQRAARADDLAGKVSLGVFAPSRAVMSNADADEPAAEQFHDAGVVEGRRTEGHDVVSAAAKRLAAGNPHEDRLALLGGQFPPLNDRDLPRDRAPEFILGRLQLPMKSL